MTYKDISFDRLIIHDIETISNLFIVNCTDYKTGKKKQFVIFKDKKFEGQALELFKFLRNCVKANYTFVGFNNLGFDSQVLHYFFEWCSAKQDPLYDEDNEFIAQEMYKKAQQIIGLQNKSNEEKFDVLVPERNLFACQIDLYKQLHYDRPAKATSLKWIQFSTCYPIIEEMPINHAEIVTIDDVDFVVDYCWNDVDTTLDFFNKMRKESELRIALSNDYELPLVNASEPKMARDIFAKFLCPQLGITYKELKTKKTIRKFVKLNDIIFKHINFLTPELNKVLNDFKKVVVDCSPGSKPTFEYGLQYHGLAVVLGLGGIHSCIEPGIYTPQDDEGIYDDDVTSFYPMLAIQNGLKPAHLGNVFSKVYNDIFIERGKYPKKDPRNYILKIVLNSAYGLSSEINTYFYDPQFTYAITINGQLSLLMYVEALYKAIPGIKFLQKNTDGVTYICKKEYLPIVEKVKKWWQDVNKLKLESAEYSKMVIMDVNNYLAINTNGELKEKGLFATKKEPHKNPSSLIIPKALIEYFTKKTQPKEFICGEERNIFDFCNGVKQKSGFKLNLIRNYNYAEIIEPQQKVCRYIISKQTNNSGSLVKDFTDGRRISAQAGVNVIPLNIIRKEQEQASLYPVDYSWYIKETNKLIQLIEPSATQQKMF